MAKLDDGWLTDRGGAAALFVVQLRAAESDSACPLFTDPYAGLFLDAAVACGWARPPGALTDRTKATAVASRTKWFDEFLTTAGANGLEQVVILAPGLDARAWRLPWIDGTVVYEIDHPRVTHFKTDTLAAHGDDPAASYVAVPVEDHRDWPTALVTAGFDASQPAAWVLDGASPDSSTAVEFVRISDLSAPGSRLAVEVSADGTEAIDWLAENGWEVSTLPAATLLDRYGRCAPDEIPELAPRTLFVEGRSPVEFTEIAS